MTLILCSVYAHRLRSSDQPRDRLWSFSIWRQRISSGDSRSRSQVVVRHAEEKASSDGTADAGIGVRIIAVSMPERPRLPARPFDLACSIRLETRLHSTD